MKYDKKFVVTIGRQFGSGGREIGSLVAKILDIKYFDKELLSTASHITGVDKEYFENSDETLPNFFTDLFSYNIGFSTEHYFNVSSPLSEESIYKAQCDVIRKIAEQDSCVIVGRSADYVLRDHPKCLNVFIHSPKEKCIERVISRGDASNVAEASQLIDKCNKKRANYYNFYTTKEWGKASSYDLTLDSSKLQPESAANIIIQFLREIAEL